MSHTALQPTTPTDFAIVAVRGCAITSSVVSVLLEGRMKTSKTSGTELEAKSIVGITGDRSASTALRTTTSTVNHARTLGIPTSTTSCSTCEHAPFTSCLYHHHSHICFCRQAVSSDLRSRSAFLFLVMISSLLLFCLLHLSLRPCKRES